MCDPDRMISDCGNYSDIPSHWGTEKKDPDETFLLALGIILDLGIGTLYLVLTGLKFGEEMRHWMRKRVGRLSKPYEKVADYLRSTEIAISVPEPRKKTPQLAVKKPEELEEVKENDLIEEVPLVVPSKTKPKKMQKKQSKRLTKKKTKQSSSTSVEKTPEKRLPTSWEPRIKYRPAGYGASSTFLPISKAKSVERIRSSSESGSSSSPYTGTSIIGMPRPMPRWNPANDQK